MKRSDLITLAVMAIVGGIVAAITSKQNEESKKETDKLVKETTDNIMKSVLDDQRTKLREALSVYHDEEVDMSKTTEELKQQLDEEEKKRRAVEEEVYNLVKETELLYKREKALLKFEYGNGLTPTDVIEELNKINKRRIQIRKRIEELHKLSPFFNKCS